LRREREKDLAAAENRATAKAFHGNASAARNGAPLPPGFVEPALATSIEKTPSGSLWIHEINFEGYGTQFHIANEGASVVTRNGSGSVSGA
jgi:ATP-dependent DNA ligase